MNSPIIRIKKAGVRSRAGFLYLAEGNVSRDRRRSRMTRTIKMTVRGPTVSFSLAGTMQFDPDGLPVLRYRQGIGVGASSRTSPLRYTGPPLQVGAAEQVFNSLAQKTSSNPEWKAPRQRCRAAFQFGKVSGNVGRPPFQSGTGARNVTSSIPVWKAVRKRWQTPNPFWKARRQR
jgi:hypothetical protein